MSDSTKTKVGKLLRVLVASGVALAGSAWPAAAAEKGADDKAAAEKEKDKAKEKAEKETKEKEKDAKGGGVKGW